MAEETDYRNIVEWDVRTWARALRFWEKIIAEEKPLLQRGLELGARRAGLTCYFAQVFGAEMICTDVEPIPAGTRQRIADLGLTGRVTYAVADAGDLPYADDTFDFVTFKSILGVVGARNRFDKIEKAIAEIHRVLRPGGLLFLAENLQGSYLHQQARAAFIPWGRSWRYLSLQEMHDLLSVFHHYELHATGFLSAFAPGSERLKAVLAMVDHGMPFIPERWRYVGYGVAWK